MKRRWIARWVALWVALFTAVASADEILIFGMAGCRPCAKLTALLERHPELLKDYKVSHIDLVEQAETAQLFAVKIAPTIVRLDDKSRERGRFTGAPVSKRQLERWLADPDVPPAE
jgi:thioredoxin-like negative regulator of GroEL